MLHHRQRTEDSMAILGEKDHRLAVVVASETETQLIPAAEPLGNAKAGVVGTAEVDTSAGEGFGDAWAADDGEGGWVQHPVGDLFAELALADAGSDGLGGDLQAFIGAFA